MAKRLMPGVYVGSGGYYYAVHPDRIEVLNPDGTTSWAQPGARGYTDIVAELERAAYGNATGLREPEVGTKPGRAVARAAYDTAASKVAEMAPGEAPEMAAKPDDAVRDQVAKSRGQAPYKPAEYANRSVNLAQIRRTDEEQSAVDTQATHDYWTRNTTTTGARN